MDHAVPKDALCADGQKIIRHAARSVRRWDHCQAQNIILIIAKSETVVSRPGSPAAVLETCRKEAQVLEKVEAQVQAKVDGIPKGQKAPGGPTQEQDPGRKIRAHGITQVVEPGRKEAAGIKRHAGNG